MSSHVTFLEAVDCNGQDGFDMMKDLWSVVRLGLKIIQSLHHLGAGVDEAGRGRKERNNCNSFCHVAE